MSSPKPLDMLIATHRAGRGALVIVEGEREDEDAWFYNQWFGSLATELTFEPQNGWRQVQRAVVALRAALPGRRVFGIIDRDCAEDELIARQEREHPTDGVYRTSRYTLENYLLDPERWLEVVVRYHRVRPPDGMRTGAELHEILVDEYRKLSSLSAYNRALYYNNTSPGATALPFARDPVRLPPDPRYALLLLERRHSTALDLASRYEVEHALLQSAELGILHARVTGKLVLPRLVQRLKLRGDARTWATHYLHYVGYDPPPDLVALIDRIRAHP